MDQNTICGWIKVYHPKGLQVTLPVIDVTPAGSLAAVTAYLEAGWLVQQPGLEEGEEKEQIGWVLRGVHEHEGRSTPFVLLYSTNDALKWSFLKVYLNTEADVRAFEHAAGVKLDALPEYIGGDKPKRGEAAKTDKFIVPVKHFGVVFKKNPKYDPSTEEGKMKAARLFVRWADQAPAPTNGHAAPAQPAKLSVTEVADWIARVKAGAAEAKPHERCDFLTRQAAEIMRDFPAGSRVECGKLLAEVAGEHGYQWSRSIQMYVKRPEPQLDDDVPF